MTTATTNPLVFAPSRTADLAGSCWNLYLVGCGGTGSWLAHHLARLYATKRVATERIHSVTLIDNDIVEKRNLGRQLFSPGDLSKPKAEVLARRYNAIYGTSFAYAAHRIKQKDIGSDGLIPASRFNRPSLILGAVDNGPTRRAIHEAVTDPQNQSARGAIYWLDTGNWAERGQVIWGNSANLEEIHATTQAVGVCEYLPYPTLVFPELMKKESQRTGGCAVLQETNQQSLNINAFVALAAIEMLVNFLEGTLSTHYVFVDLKHLEMSSQPITPSYIANLLAERSNHKR